MRPAFILRLLLIVAVVGCNSGSQPEPVQYTVPAEVERYVESFRKEAKQRNSVVSTSNLIVTFGTIQTKDACGQCVLESGKTPRITLNADGGCWKTATEQERECLVFHELGHCLLNRSHKTERFPNGAFISLMNPNDRSVYTGCPYPIDDECDKRYRRSYYIDELFNPATPMPVWGK